MIIDRQYLDEFEKKIAREEKPDFHKNLEIYEAMWQEAMDLGIFPLKNPYEGLEDDIEVARILNRFPQDNYSMELQ